jgi:methylphosphotriester-DNA--protein-cysteine methyltransferase
MIATRSKTPKPMPPSVADGPRWARIVARDKTADGHLWYSVATTGVYCRPSCHSRVADPKNVQLHDSLESARATGFRPCRRCNPDGPSIECENVALVAKVCRTIEATEEEPSLQELAAAIGRSPSYFHRVFKAATGLTPKECAAAAHRAKKVRRGLVSGNTVTEAIYEAGFNSSGRFCEKSTHMLGMTASQYRAGGTIMRTDQGVGPNEPHGFRNCVAASVGNACQCRRRHPLLCDRVNALWVRCWSPVASEVSALFCSARPRRASPPVFPMPSSSRTWRSSTTIWRRCFASWTNLPKAFVSRSTFAGRRFSAVSGRSCARSL